MREVWEITACLDLISVTSSHYNEGLAPLDIEKEFYRLLGDLYSLCRIKVIFIALHNELSYLVFDSSFVYDAGVLLHFKSD